MNTQYWVPYTVQNDSAYVNKLHVNYVTSNQSKYRLILQRHPNDAPDTKHRTFVPTGYGWYTVHILKYPTDYFIWKPVNKSKYRGNHVPYNTSYTDSKLISFELCVYHYDTFLAFVIVFNISFVHRSVDSWIMECPCSRSLQFIYAYTAATLI